MLYIIYQPERYYCFAPPLMAVSKTAGCMLPPEIANSHASARRGDYRPCAAIRWRADKILPLDLSGIAADDDAGYVSRPSRARAMYGLRRSSPLTFLSQRYGKVTSQIAMLNIGGRGRDIDELRWGMASAIST